MVTLEQLIKIMPKAKTVRVAQYLTHLNKAMLEFEINTPLRMAAFLAQIGHESGYFAHVEENLNYRAETLMRVWPRRFPTLEKAKQFAHNPQKIANSVYANRMGNRGEETGDGYAHRGAGLLQLTGRSNQFEAALALDIDIEKIGEYLRSAEGACRSAAWWWKSRGLNELADKQEFKRITRIINGGYIGLEDRLKLYAKAKQVLL